MPSTYAHKRIGGEVAGLLPSVIRQTVRGNYDCYALGLHGPDLLFYYKPLQSNCVNAIGYAIHGRPASEFFAGAKDVYLLRGGKDCDAAYLYGFLCHFALDSEAHPYVNRKIAESGVTHTEIESCFDRYLMLLDGALPSGCDTTSHIVVSERICEIASAYFGITQKQALRAVRSMKKYNKLMTSKSRFLRGGAVAALKLSGCYREMHGMMLPQKDDPRCADSNLILLDIYEKAVGKAVRLIENLNGFLGGTSALGKELERDFE